MTGNNDEGEVATDARIERLILALERLAAGDLDERVPISSRHDGVDAVAHGLNVLAAELQYETRNLRRALHEAQAASRAKTAVLRKAGNEIRLQLEGLAGHPKAPGLVELAEGLLDLSRLEDEGPFHFVAERVPLRETVAEVVQSLEAAARRKGLELVLEVVAPVPQAIAVDAGRLRHILAHVAGNAIKFTQKGRVLVRLQAAGPDAIALDVIDTGIGIPASEAESVFRPFLREPSEARALEGAGLGLALARRLARGMGGDVRLVESSPQGTTFSVLLPVGT
jgi:signal transduction histidine kinase